MVNQTDIGALGEIECQIRRGSRHKGLWVLNILCPCRLVTMKKRFLNDILHVGVSAPQYSRNDALKNRSVAQEGSSEFTLPIARRTFAGIHFMPPKILK